MALKQPGSAKNALSMITTVIIMVVVAGVGLALIAGPASAANENAGQEEYNRGEVSAFKEHPILIDAESIEYSPEGTVVRASGVVKVEYEDLLLTADDLEVDLVAEKLVATGRVVVQKGGIRAEGIYLLYDFKNDRSEMRDVSTEVEGVRLKGEALTVDPHGLHLVNGYFTKCDLPMPEYRISTTHLEVYRGKRIVAEGATIWVGERPLFTMPRIVLSLGPGKVWQAEIPIPRLTYSLDGGLTLGLVYSYPPNDYATVTYDLTLLTAKGLRAGVVYSYDAWPGIKASAELVHQTWYGTSGGIVIEREAQNHNLRLELMRRADVDGNIVDSLPSITLEVGPFKMGALPLELVAQAGAGLFHEWPADLTTSRSDVKLGLRSGRITLAGGLIAEFDISQRGTWYGTGDIRTVTEGGIKLDKELSENLGLSLGYAYRQVGGDSPFAFDRLGSQKDIFGRLVTRLNQQWSAEVATTYSLVDGAVKEWGYVLTRHYHCFDVRASWQQMERKFGLEVRLTR